MSRRSIELENFTARVLEDHGLPSQQCSIQVSYLTWAASDLALIVTLPLRMERQGAPTGVIQIGTPKRIWNPEIKVLIPEAARYDPFHLKALIERHLRDGLALMRREVEGKGLAWPPGWARLEVVPGGAAASASGGVTAAGKLLRR